MIAILNLLAMGAGEVADPTVYVELSATYDAFAELSGSFDAFKELAGTFDTYHELRGEA